jgi:hypothetical protein
LIRSRDEKAHKVMTVAIGVGGLVAVIMIIIIGMVYSANVGSMPNGVFVQGVIFVIVSAIVTGITVAAARWIRRSP